MKHRQPTSITTFTRYTVKAKNLRKGDSIRLGERSYTIKSNVKNDYGQRVLNLRWGNRKQEDEATIIVPAKVRFDVNKASSIRKPRV